MSYCVSSSSKLFVICIEFEEAFYQSRTHSSLILFYILKLTFNFRALLALVFPGRSPPDMGGNMDENNRICAIWTALHELKPLSDNFTEYRLSGDTRGVYGCPNKRNIIPSGHENALIDDP